MDSTLAGFQKGRVECIADIAAAGTLMHFEIKVGDNSQQMIEDVRLDAFVLNPTIVIREDIDLEWKTLGPGLELSNQEVESLLMNLRVVAYIRFDVGTEGTDVGLLAAIDIMGIGNGVLLVTVIDFLNLPLEIVVQKMDLLPRIQHFGSRELDRGDVDVDGTLDASST